MNGRYKRRFLTIIVPAYKEEKVIVMAIRRMMAVLDTIRYDYEILVVVDGILDASLEKLKKARLPNVRVFAYKKNQGKWYAIRLGMKYARGEYVMFVDGGMEIDPNGISMLLEHMEWYEADIIVGSKRHPASQVHYTLLRKILSYGYYYLVRILLGVSVTDTQAGIKILRHDVVEKILPRFLEKRFSGDLEMLVIARLLGYRRIYEAPIKLNFQLAGLSSAASIRSIWHMFIDTLAIFYRAHVVSYYSRAYRTFREPKKLLIVNPPRRSSRKPVVA